MLAASVSDYRELARRRLPRMLFNYVDGGAYAERTLAANIADFEAISLRQRVMRDMSSLNMSVELQGRTYQLPVGLSPVGLAGMYGRRGEAAAARAARDAGVPFCLSTMGVCSIEEVAAASEPPWFQLYMLKDRGFMKDLLARVRAAGAPVLVLTVDLPAPGARYRDIRTGFTGQSGLSSALRQAWDGLAHPAWLWDVWAMGRPHTLGSVGGAAGSRQQASDFLGWIGQNFDRSVTWDDMDWVRQHWDGPIVVKGVLDPADARDALSAGAQGVTVSNHGGRQLDGVRSAIRALEPIVQALGGDLEIYMDGGVRSGLDVLKALSLGARACFLGRAWAYALGAGGGQRTVARMLDTFRAELTLAMILTGCADLRRAGPEMLDRG